jgi:uncharacterized protein (TIGR02328 family)
MRCWHNRLLPYLPDAQFKGQLRELVLIMHQWRDKGATNHLLINKVMEYPKNDFVRYFLEYDVEYHKRYGKWLAKAWEEFKAFDDTPIEQRSNGFFDGWHNKEYLRVCMANLYEKHFFGVGKSRITDEEWETLYRGYKEITGEEYLI